FAEHVNPAAARFRPVFGSDISHWDVPDMTTPVAEAFELVEQGLIGEREFEELMFVNPVRLHAEMNPLFFAGTRAGTSA
ncbi:MAG TPA: amidohydrolase, partial [Acidimicrobiia bacterium]|nr:amidohydrolase [Acidimicrobiia bacterium]